jgi:hypothetical protein
MSFRTKFIDTSNINKNMDKKGKNLWKSKIHCDYLVPHNKLFRIFYIGHFAKHIKTDKSIDIL